MTLWEALHGERPFAGDTVVELATHVTEGRLREPPRGGAGSRDPKVAEIEAVLEDARQGAGLEER